MYALSDKLLGHRRSNAKVPRSGDHEMDVRTTLEPLLQELPDDRLRQLIDYARFLAWQEERKNWQDFGQSQLAKAYGPDEPEYSLSDIKTQSAS
jgi:hypothetical protein